MYIHIVCTGFVITLANRKKSVYIYFLNQNSYNWHSKHLWSVIIIIHEESPVPSQGHGKRKWTWTNIWQIEVPFVNSAHAWHFPKRTVFKKWLYYSNMRWIHLHRDIFLKFTVLKTEKCDLEDWNLLVTLRCTTTLYDLTEEVKPNHDVNS